MFDVKCDEGIFLGSSLYSKAYIVFNKKTFVVEEFVHVYFDESNSSKEDKVINVDKDYINDTPKDMNNNDYHIEQ